MGEENQNKPNDVSTDENRVSGGVEKSVLIPKIDFHDSQSNEDQTLSEKKQPSKNKRFSKKFKIFLAVIASIFVVVSAIIVYFVFVLRAVYNSGLKLQSSVEKVYETVLAQDLPRFEEEIENTRISLSEFNSSYGKISWLANFPIVGDYVKDGQHAINASNYGLDSADILVGVVKPYADIIGISGSVDETADGFQTAQDRLDFVVKTLPDVLPKVESLSEKVSLIKNEIGQIDPYRYPEEFRGIKIRDKFMKGKDLLNLGDNLLSSGRPLLEVSPDLLGTKGSKRYLVLFQNDKELRPTGGFLTAYSIAMVENGKFNPVSSNDIYNLDNKYSPSVPASRPVIKYLKGPYMLSRNFRLRDINWSPDFAESMKLFSEESAKVGIKDIDGIIAVDTQLLVNILNVLGPIGVPGFGNFSTEIDERCNCPQVIYELESFADVEGSVVWDQLDPTKIIFAPPNYENRKKIIGPLMNSVLSNALGQSKEKIPALFTAVMNSLLDKHVLFYLTNEDEQKAVESFGIAGTIKEFDGDYLHINDANLGGRKSNLYVTHKVEQDIEISNDGTVTKTITVTYNNSEKHDGWLNSVLPNWVRIYVPKGSELIDFQGVEESEDPYEDLGKTVFAGFFKLRPQGLAKVVVTYKLPFKVSGDVYRILIQKQPGKDAPRHTINIGNYSEEFAVSGDKELTIKL